MADSIGAVIGRKHGAAVFRADSMDNRLLFVPSML